MPAGLAAFVLLVVIALYAYREHRRRRTLAQALLRSIEDLGRSSHASDDIEMSSKYDVDEQARFGAEVRRVVCAITAERSVGSKDSAAADGARAGVRFAAKVAEMVMGQPEFAALGLDHFMCVPTSAVPPSVDEGVAAIVQEIETHGTAEDKECLHYVLHEAAGSSDRLFANSPHPRDCDAHGVRADRRRPSDGAPMRFDDFVAHREAQRGNLHAPHVLALRLYTTAAFVSINTPLRKLSAAGNQCAEPHPFPNVVRFMRDAIRQLRSNYAPERGTQRTVQYLYRGLKDLRPSDDFMERGGSELGPMSTTTSLEVALRYATSATPVIVRLKIANFMQRGADISFCSAYPAEKEVVYPPQTFILPERRNVIEGVTIVDAQVTVG